MIEQSFSTAVRPSPRVLQTASMFGIGVDESHRLSIVPPVEIDLPIPGPGVVFITGPSGGGKSTVLRLIESALCARELPDDDIDCARNRAPEGMDRARTLAPEGALCARELPSFALRRAREHDVVKLEDLPALADRPLVDVFDVPFAKATSLLAMAGLGDAFLMLRRPRELSDGQRGRLRLAQAMEIASRSSGAVILADEFGATLDRLTARIIARNVRRWVDRERAARITFIAATTHVDLLEDFEPDVLIWKGLGDEMEVCAGPSPTERGEVGDLRIDAGSARDYKALAQFHYRGPKIGVVTSAYRLVHESRSVVGHYLQRRSDVQIVGVILRALPHLACSLRDVATGGRYREGLSPRESARVLNREMRTLIRIVIHPQWRGLGLAVRLVKHALAHPEPGQVYTEGLAAMGQVHPFLEKAGMTRLDRPPRAEHARLLDALARLEIEPYMLASPRMFLERLRTRDEMTQVWFEDELSRWCRSGARRRRGRIRGRGCKDASGERTIEEMVALARDQLLMMPVYYLYRHGSTDVEPQINAGER